MWKTRLCSVVYTCKIPRNNGTKFLIQHWQFFGVEPDWFSISKNFQVGRSFVFGKLCQPLATCDTENILTPNRLMMPCCTLHSKMLSKQLRLSKSSNTSLESTLKGSGLILPLNNSWKNGNYTLSSEPLTPSDTCSL